MPISVCECLLHLKQAHPVSDVSSPWQEVAAGGDNAEKTSIYKVGRGGWEPGPDMAVGRGYQSSTTLGNGEVRVNTCSFVANATICACPREGCCGCAGQRCISGHVSSAQAPGLVRQALCLIYLMTAGVRARRQLERRPQAEEGRNARPLCSQCGLAHAEQHWHVPNPHR